MTLTLPKYVIPRPLSGGRWSYHWSPPNKDKKRALDAGETFPFSAVKLGEDLSQKQLDDAAAPHNDMLSAWRKDRHEAGPAAPVYGTVGWLLRQYQKENVFLESVAPRSRGDYRNVLEKVASHPTKSEKHPTVGDLPVSSMTARAAQKIYSHHADRGTLRTAEKVQEFCTGAWKRMQPLYPQLFLYQSGHFINPWAAVARKKRRKATKPAVDRATVYAFARAAIEAGRPECAAAAVICFEWLQRPENVVEGHITWNDYRGPGNPHAIRIYHHKTDQSVEHPLEDTDPDTGEPILLYSEAEEILSHLPRRGVSMILGPQNQSYTASRFWRIIQDVRKKTDIPYFTLDACRHGGMTELEEAELTEGQGRALSAHRTSRHYSGYAKLTAKRILSATLKRRAHLIADNGEQNGDKVLTAQRSAVLTPVKK